VTHNSLVATQRPHISLIDRRHLDYAAFPIGPLVKRNGCLCEAEAVAHPLTALSHINVRVLAPRMRSVASWRRDVLSTGSSFRCPPMSASMEAGQDLVRGELH
jgi:hypothetical protein